MDKIAWAAAHKLLKPYWVDPATAPGSVKKKLYGGEDLSHNGPLNDWLVIRSQFTNKQIPRWSIVRLLKSKGLSHTQIIEIFPSMKDKLDSVLDSAKASAKYSDHAKSLAKQIVRLFETKITWREAEKRLGEKIDPESLPVGLWKRVFDSSVTGSRDFIRSYETMPCPLCGRKEKDPKACPRCLLTERKRLTMLIYETSPSVSVGELVGEALKQNMDGGLIRILGASQKDLAHPVYPSDPEAVEKVQKLLKAKVDLYALGGSTFDLVSSGPLGEVRLGRANKHLSDLDGIVLVTPRDMEFIRLFLNSISLQEISKKMGGVMVGRYGQLKEKFGAANAEDLRQRMAGYGLEA